MALAPRPTVEIAFDLSLVGQGDFFTLGDDVKGELNNSVYLVAGGDILQDVSQYVRSISLRRGRPRELQDVDAGSLTVELDNRLRLFDPSNLGNLFDDPEVIFNDTVATFDGLGEGSPYAPDIVPRKRVRVTSSNTPLFVGIVEDWDLRYLLDNDRFAIAKCADGFAYIARQLVPSGTASVELVGARIDGVLDDLGWPASDRSIDDGINTLGADVIGDNQAAIGYLQKAARSDLGIFFANKAGQLEFRDQNALQTATDIRFSNTGGGIPFSNIEVDFGTESLFNSVAVQYVSGSVTAQDTVSQGKYGISDVTVETLVSSASVASNIATLYLSRYSEPFTRIRSLDIYYDGLTPAQRAQIINLEIADIVQVYYDPGYGTPISQSAAIDQIEHTITSRDWRVRLNMSQATGSFIIGSSLLDEGTAGF